MIPQLLQPSGDVFVSLVFADIVDKQGPNGAAVVGRGNSAVTFLSSGIPNLRLDGFRIDLDRPGGELNADGRLGVQIELVTREPTEKVRLSDTGISD